LINLSFQNAETDMDAFDLFFEKQMRWGFHWCVQNAKCNILLNYHFPKFRTW
jgi:hypothetical protein